MKKIIILYSLALAIIIGLLKFLEYRYIIRAISVELYMGIIAAIFTIIGVWVGLKLIGSKNASNETNIIDDKTALINAKNLNISNREFEVLQLIAKGYSNQEIADQLFVSISTIKTHSSNLFVKLNVKRRTQAITKAKELSII